MLPLLSESHVFELNPSAAPSPFDVVLPPACRNRLFRVNRSTRLCGCPSRFYPFSFFAGHATDARPKQTSFHRAISSPPHQLVVADPIHTFLSPHHLRTIVLATKR
ncbi:uncharacterized protein PgNI_07925 [Pyricularia grisea]|uniref:Uncharacterized protein n=1 Tax=Pyricularia grisea TaxID=148305 RepID=A0A6P8B1D5_PYRGI|nr:uncharacterized protein PgNI_07925 [Pyricularia grisea]TLD08538.1 hypothetical protein PgNI_07925 [Pyricularia grisea]